MASILLRLTMILLTILESHHAKKLVCIHPNIELRVELLNWGFVFSFRSLMHEIYVSQHPISTG